MSKFNFFEEHYIYVQIEFIEDVLGTAPNNKDVYRDYIAKNAPDAETKEEEIARLGEDEVAEKGITAFPKVDGKPLIYGYQLQGFFKSACPAVKNASPKSKSAKLKAYKKFVDKEVWVSKLNFIYNFDSIGELQRPLRAQTPQGERVSIAVSEKISRGAKCEFIVKVFKEEDVEYILEWLHYGQYNGLLQWRNSRKGTFLFTAKDESGNILDSNMDKLDLIRQEDNEA